MPLGFTWTGASRARMMYNLVYFMVVAVCGTSQVHGDGQIQVQFTNFSNLAGKRFDNELCDSKWGFQTSLCDHYFVVCVGNTEGAGHGCEYGSHRTAAVSNRNVIDFKSTPGTMGYRAPLQFAFTGGIKREVALRVTVYDDDRKDDDLVDNLFSNVRLNQNHAVTLNLIARTNLLLSVWVECSATWYGPQCGVSCVPSTHYTCDPTTGYKQCHPGYYGDSCQHRSTTTTAPPTAPPTERPRGDNEDCDTLAQAGHRYQDGVYTLQAREGGPFRAYCDMSAEGWTVIQRRTDGRLDFGRSWAEYRAGFGEPGAVTEYWLGLDHLNHLTKYKRYRLRVTMQLGNAEFRFATYDRFSVGDVTSGYQLTVSGYAGTAGDALQYTGLDGRRRHSGRPFSTPDHDRDNWDDGSCAQVYGGGWWFNDCYWSNLNGPYVRATNGWPRCPDGACVTWRTVPGYEDHSLLRTEMEIMPYY